MGYTTNFEGSFLIDKPLDDETFNLINGLANTRRMKRGGLDEKYGVEGEFYIGDDEDNPKEGVVLGHNTPPSTQPGLWLQWIVMSDRRTIEWDGGEKFYDYVEWLQYIIDKILEPKGYVVNGEVFYSGEEVRDNGTIVVKDNIVVK